MQHFEIFEETRDTATTENKEHLNSNYDDFCRIKFMPGTRHSRLIVRDEREWNRYRRPIRRSGSPHRTRYTEPHTSLLAVTLVYIALFLRSRCVGQFVVQFVKRARIKKEKSKKRKYIFNWYSLGSGGLVGWPCAIESIIYLVVEPFRIIIGNIMVPALWPDLNICSSIQWRRICWLSMAQQQQQ